MGSIRERAIKGAAQTESKVDDVRARNLPKGLDDVLYDDAVTADEYDNILIHSAIGKYM